MKNIFSINREMKTNVISTKITKEQYDKLIDLCKKHNIKKAQLLNNLITNLLEENK